MKRTLFIILITIPFNLLIAQTNNTSQHIPLIEFIKNVENKFNVKCFYEENWASKYNVYNTINETDLESVLTQALKGNSQLKYFIYQDNYIIFTELLNIDQTDIYYSKINYLKTDVSTANGSESDREEKVIHQQMNITTYY